MAKKWMKLQLTQSLLTPEGSEEALADLGFPPGSKRVWMSAALGAGQLGVVARYPDGRTLGLHWIELQEPTGPPVELTPEEAAPYS